MSQVSTVVNVNPDAGPATPANLNVRAFFNETDAGHLFGPFSTKERAEQCAVVLAGRAGVLKAVIEPAA